MIPLRMNHSRRSLLKGWEEVEMLLPQHLDNIWTRILRKVAGKLEHGFLLNSHRQKLNFFMNSGRSKSWLSLNNLKNKFVFNLADLDKSSMKCLPIRCLNKANWAYETRLAFVKPLYVYDGIAFELSLGEKFSPEGVDVAVNYDRINNLGWH